MIFEFDFSTGSGGLPGTGGGLPGTGQDENFDWLWDLRVRFREPMRVEVKDISLEVSCSVLYVPLGLRDYRDMRALISSVAPLQLVIILLQLISSVAPLQLVIILLQLISSVAPLQLVIILLHLLLHDIIISDCGALDDEKCLDFFIIK